MQVGLDLQPRAAAEARAIDLQILHHALHVVAGFGRVDLAEKAAGSGVQRNLDALCLQRRDDCRIGNGITVAVKFLQVGESEQCLGVRKAIAQADPFDPIEPGKSRQIQIEQHG